MSTAAQQLQRALEERAKEIEQLQNKLQRAEVDRKQWEQQKRVLESKQPQDVQALIRQKRELHSQLQREESEKQELFMQINKLIGEVAELQQNAEEPNLFEEANKRLENQLQQLTAENNQLKSTSHSAQQKFQSDLQDQKQEVGRLQKSHEQELNRLSNELRKIQKEVEVKDAALQSLKLARPSSKEDTLGREVDKLKTELAQRSQENAKLLAQKVELEQFKSRLTDELQQLKRQLNDHQEKLVNSGRAQDEILEVFEHAGIPSTSGMGTLKRKIDSLKSDANDETTRRKKLETELDQLHQTLNSSNTARQELTRRIEELRDENERLTEKASVEEELHTLMLSLREAKSEVAAKETEATSWRQKSLRFEEQCDQLQSDLSHKQTALQKAENELHALRSTAVDTDILSKLETELHEAKHEAENQRQKLRDALANREHVDAELAQNRHEIAEFRDQITSITAKLEESELKRQQLEQKRVDEMRRLRDDHRVEVDRMRRDFVDEKERIEDKVTVAEEDAKKAHTNAEETRRSVEEAQKRLANALGCSVNFDLMLTTIGENQRRFDELKSQLDSGDNHRREHETQLSDELSRLKQREYELESALSRAKYNEQQSEVNLEKQQLLESDRDELTKMNDELNAEMRHVRNLHDAEMKNMRDEMIENIRRLSDLLEAETKRLQTANNERDKWLNEANRLEHECRDLRQQLDSKSTNHNHHLFNDSETAELRSKVAELMDENAKLAGDLLKLESSGSDSAVEAELRQAQRHFSEEQLRWKKERVELEAKIDELRRQQNGSITNGINGHNGNPTPKPRKINGNGLASPLSLTNLAAELADEFPTNGSDGDPTKIQSELEKQKRLITVLRKKLQHQNIERVKQSRSFCTS